eukprot:scaffold34915_cov180-Amphora_coffeaeformis.AAC.11
MDDLESQSSSESALLLLISSDTADMTTPPPALPMGANNTGNEWDDSFSVHSCHDHESLSFGSEIILRNMEARKRSRRPRSLEGTSLQQSLRTGSRYDDGSISTRKLSAKTEDSSTSNKYQVSEGTFETLRTEKTGRSSFGSWIKKKVLRFNKHGKKATPPRKQSKMNSKECHIATKNIPGHVTVVDGSESIDNTERDLSSWLGSMSVGEIRKVFGSGESIEVTGKDPKTTHADNTLPRTFTDLMEDDESVSGPNIDFRNRLNIYKARSSAYNKNNDDVQTKVRRLNKEASFMLMSFSVASSDSDSSSDNTGDDSTTDDNLAEAIAKEMDLRRLIMGDRPEKLAIGIEEVIIPTPKTKIKKRDILSPHHVNGSNQVRSSGQLTKPTTPLQQLAGFFFNPHNHENICGASTPSAVSP